MLRHTLMNCRMSAIKGYLGTSKTDQKALAVYTDKHSYKPVRMQTQCATNLHVYIPCLSSSIRQRRDTCNELCARTVA